jgi:hypothetical protein
MRRMALLFKFYENLQVRPSAKSLSRPPSSATIVPVAVDTIVLSIEAIKIPNKSPATTNPNLLSDVLQIFPLFYMIENVLLSATFDFSLCRNSFLYSTSSISQPGPIVTRFPLTTFARVYSR